MSDIAVAALLAVTILAATTVSVELGLSVALIELVAGFVVGNAFHVPVPGWLAFLGTFAGIVLTFQAGAEVAMIAGLPRLSPGFFGRYGNRVIEPEIKLVFACLLVLM